MGVASGQLVRDRWRVSGSEAVRRAALFPEVDLLAPAPGHPNRRVSVAGVVVRLPAEVPHALVSPYRIEESQVEQVVKEVREFLRAEGRANSLWFVSEEALPVNLAERLQALGMRPNDVPGAEAREAMMVAVSAPPTGPSRVVVRRPTNFEEFLAAHMVAVDAFAMDETMRRAFEGRAKRLWPFEASDGQGATFVALLDGEVIAAAAAVFGKTAVYLGGAGTRPDQRGRGAYTALVRARWDAAVERGTPVLTVGAGAMSRPILQRLGFSIVGWADCLLDELAT